jgi:hypothetical protein
LLSTVTVAGLESVRHLLDERVRLLEFHEAQAAAVVLVEHAHDAFRNGVAELQATIAQGGLKFARIDAAAAVLVHRVEPLACTVVDDVGGQCTVLPAVRLRSGLVVTRSGWL